MTGSHLSIHSHGQMLVYFVHSPTDRCIDYSHVANSVNVKSINYQSTADAGSLTLVEYHF
jgi:hypothetical protein